MLRWIVPFLTAVFAVGTAAATDAPVATKSAVNRAASKLPPGLPRAHYKYRTTIAPAATAQSTTHAAIGNGGTTFSIWPVATSTAQIQIASSSGDRKRRKPVGSEKSSGTSGANGAGRRKRRTAATIPAATRCRPAAGYKARWGPLA